MMEAPRVEILREIGADRIFEFLANPILETPFRQYSRDPLPSRVWCWEENDFSDFGSNCVGMGARGGTIDDGGTPS